MKNVYITPEAYVVNVELEDIIRTSDGSDNDSGGGNSGGSGNNGGSGLGIELPDIDF